VRGRPADVPINTFYGFTDNRLMDTDVNVATVALTHRFNQDFSVKNTVRYGDYERKFLTHLYSGAAAYTGANAGTIARSQALRLNTQENVYNQTDFVFKKPLFGFNNTLMFGSEFCWEEYDFKSKNSTGVSRISIFNPVVTASSTGLASDFSSTLATDRLTHAQTYAVLCWINLKSTKIGSCWAAPVTMCLKPSRMIDWAWLILKAASINGVRAAASSGSPAMLNRIISATASRSILLRKD
jgi:outer membrane receptor for monomeric catechols